MGLMQKWLLETLHRAKRSTGGQANIQIDNNFFVQNLEHDYTIRSFTLLHIKSIFTILALGLALSVIAFILEFVKFKCL